MCKGTTNMEEVYIINLSDTIKNKLPCNAKWIDYHGGLPVDKCIGKEVEFLLNKGVITYGCCCGHNKEIPTCLVDEASIDLCNQLGYEITSKLTDKIYNIKLKGNEFFDFETNELLLKLSESGKRIQELLNITEEDIYNACKELRKLSW